MRFRTAALGLIFVGCYSSGEGISPPLERIYFPVGLAIDKANTRLYVASSDFDLQFNSGAVQALNLDRIRRLLPRECELDGDCNDGEYCDVKAGGSFLCTDKSGKYADKPCRGLGEQTLAQRVTVPGLCGHVELGSLGEEDSILVDAVRTGAFATEIQLKHGPNGEGRLFLPIRGEASLTWIDLDDTGKMKCWEASSAQRKCAGKYIAGTDVDENSRNEKMPSEPYGLAINDEGDAIAISHQTSGAVSLFHQDPKLWADGPRLEYVQRDLPLQALAVAAVPTPKVVSEARANWLAKDYTLSSDPYPPGFLVAYRNAAQIDLLRFYADRKSIPVRPYLQLASTVGITANTSDYDSRGIAFDDVERKACEDKCGNIPAENAEASVVESRQTCLAQCAVRPIGVYVATRSPASLLVGETIRDTWSTPNRDVPHFYDSVPLPTGPSRVYVGKVVGADGNLETRVFVVCFDQRRIAIYDPIRRRIEAFVTTGRGPHALAFDYAPADEASGTKARALAYVAHFTDSYLGVIELDRRKIRNYANIVLNLGPATAPRASK